MKKSKAIIELFDNAEYLNELTKNPKRPISHTGEYIKGHYFISLQDDGTVALKQVSMGGTVFCHRVYFELPLKEAVHYMRGFIAAMQISRRELDTLRDKSMAVWD
jgi:hypothetical protein